MKIIDLKNTIGSPARKAFESLGITLIEDFNNYTRAQIADTHGIGQKALKIIELEMKRLKVKYKHEGESVEVDNYLEDFNDELKNKLKELRKIIRGIIPEAKEKIAYGMPTYYYKENVVHFAGFKKHIGFYPTPSGITKFKKELEQYKTSKGAIQFPIAGKLPIKLIIAITKYRMNVIEEK